MPVRKIGQDVYGEQMSETLTHYGPRNLSAEDRRIDLSEEHVKCPIGTRGPFVNILCYFVYKNGFDTFLSISDRIRWKNICCLLKIKVFAFERAKFH